MNARARKSAVLLPLTLIGLAVVVAVLVCIAVVVPDTRMNVGRLVALVGLVLFVYGYGSGAYIAFTEDDLYGWLYLLFPPYAAYYFVSRWDEMRSRLVMLARRLGSARRWRAVARGGTPRRCGRQRRNRRAALTDNVAGFAVVRAQPVDRGGLSNQLADRLVLVEQVHRPAASVGDGGARGRCRGCGRASRTRSGMRPAVP